MDFTSARSTREKPGPRTGLRGSFPTCPALVASVSRAKHAVLNHCAGVRAPPSFGSHVMFGRLGSDVSEMLFGSTTVNGKPVCACTMPLNCQPPRTDATGAVQ